MNEDYGGMVERGYSETNGCLEFLVSFNKYNFDLLKKAVLKTLKLGYNEFSAKRFVTAFEKIEHLVMRVQFGRQYSPVAYIVLKYDAPEDAVDQVHKAFKLTKFDEFHVGLDTVYDKCKSIRLWWD